MSEPYPKSVDSVVRNLRNRILRVRQRGELIGEQDTIRVFITPLLTALEWDIDDLDEVKNEYRHRSQDNPVDYALFMLRSPCLFLEAKSLNASIEDRRWVTQTLVYAVAAGVEWCVLTNGDEYRLYNAHAPVEVDEKLFRAVKVSDESSHELTIETLGLLSKNKMSEKQLNVLWKAHFVDRRIKSALDELIKKQNDGLVRLLRKFTSKSLTISDIKNSLKRVDITISFPFLISDRPVLPPTIKGEERRKSRSTKEQEERLRPKSSFSLEKSNLPDEELKKRFLDTLERRSDLTPRVIAFMEIVASENRVFNRGEVKNKLFEKSIGDDIGQTGRYLSNISQFLTKGSNPHLRQVVEFESGGSSGQMKDNYRIIPSYRKLVLSVLEKIKTEKKHN